MVRTYVGNDAANNDLLLPRGFNCLSEVRIIPGVNFAVTPDEGGIGMHVDNFFDQRTIWPFIQYRGQSCAKVSNRDDLPLSALVVSIVGRLNALPIAACAMMLFLNSSGL